MEWKIELRHKELGWSIEIIGIGKNPHKVDEVIIKANPNHQQVKNLIEEIKFVVSHPPAFLPHNMIQSEKDMYLWRFATWKAGRDWGVKDNLPKEEYKEDEEIKKLRKQGIVPIF